MLYFFSFFHGQIGFCILCFVGKQKEISSSLKKERDKFSIVNARIGIQDSSFNHNRSFLHFSKVVKLKNIKRNHMILTIRPMIHNHQRNKHHIFTQLLIWYLMFFSFVVSFVVFSVFLTLEFNGLLFKCEFLTSYTWSKHQNPTFVLPWNRIIH